MNIIFLTSRLPYPPHQGDKLRIMNLIRQLSVEHDVTLITFIADKAELQHIPKMQEYCRKVIPVYLPKWRSLLNCFLALFSSTPFQVAYFASGRMQQIVNETIAAGTYDVLHVHLIRMAQYASGRKETLRRVLDLTDAVTLYLERFLAIEPGFIKKVFLRHEIARLRRYEHILERFDLNVVCSEVDRRYLRQRLPNAAIELSFNGIDLDYFSSNGAAKAHSHHIVFTGNMKYFPNEDGIIYFVEEILPLIRRKIPDAKLSVVGQNPSAKLRRLESDSIAVTGFVPDIKEYYLQSAVAIAPIRFGAGTPTKLIEALAMGIPVVTTSVGAGGLALEHGTDLLIADSPELFADAVVRILTDDLFRESLARNGSAAVRERFDAKIVSQRLSKMYKGLTGTGVTP